MLARLLREIEALERPATAAELAGRLGVSRSEVEAMMAMLRAAGRIVPDLPPEPEGAACTSSGSCRLACPGPAECPMVVDFQTAEMALRRHG